MASNIAQLNIIFVCNSVEYVSHNLLCVKCYIIETMIVFCSSGVDNLAFVDSENEIVPKKSTKQKKPAEIIDRYLNVLLPTVAYLIS